MSIDSGPTVRVNPAQVTIWWYSSSTGSSELRYGSQPDTWANLATDISNTTTTLGTLHSRTISNLATGTYYYRVRTVGALGTATSGVHEFTVEAPNAATPLGSTVVGGSVYAVVTSGTRTYLGGDFDQIGTRLGAGLEVNPTTAALVGNSGTPQVAGRVFASIADGAGGWYIGGHFERVGGLARGGVAHILPDGGVDPIFTTGSGIAGGIDFVNALVVSGTRLYVGGYFATYAGTSRNNLVAVNATTGALDTGFNPGTGPDIWVRALAVSGTRLYLGGLFTTYNGTGRNYIAAVDATTGALDTGFNPGTGIAGGYVNALVISGTRLYIGGCFSSYNGTGRNNIAAVDTTTAALDTGFNPGTGASSCVSALAVSGTRLYLGGSFATYNGTGRNSIAAVDTTTAAIDTGFNPGTGTNGMLSSLAVSGTRLYLGGVFTTYNGTTRNYIAAVDTTTAAIDAGFNPGTGPNNTVDALAVSGSRLYLGGVFTGYGGTTRANLAAVDATTGAIDTGFDPGTGVTGTSMTAVRALLVSGTRLYLGGEFTAYNGTARSGIAAVDTTTAALDTGFNPGTGVNLDGVDSLAVSGTRLYLGGDFTQYNGTARNNLVAVDTTTAAIDTGFTPGTGTGGYLDPVSTMLVSGGRLYIGGDFTDYNGTARNNVAAVSLTTAAIIAGFDPGTGTNGDVNALAVSGTRLYLGGNFTTYNGTTRNRLAAVDSTGALDAGFTPGAGAGNVINAMKVSGTSLFLGGLFTTYNGTTRNGLAAVNTATAALDTTFDPDGGAIYGAQPAVNALAVSATQLYIGGGYYKYNDVSQSGVAMVPLTSTGMLPDAGPLSITVAAQHNVAPHQTTVWWTTSASSSSELRWDTESHSDFADYQRDESNTATSLGTAHSRTIANLPAGTYYYRVRSRTAAGEQVTSAEYSFRIDSPDASTPLGSTVVSGYLDTTALSSDGSTLYLGGSFDQVGTRMGAGLPVNTTTGTRRAGAPQVNGAVKAVVPDGNGGWYIGGVFTYVGGLARTRIAHILPDGGVDPTFTTVVDGLAITASVEDLALSGTTLYVGGTFTSIGGQPRTSIGAIDTTTGNATAFNPNSDASVVELLVSGTTLYVGGNFANIGGQPRNRIAALDTTTGNATAFNPNPTGSIVRAFALNGTTLYVGGTFTNMGGQARNNIAALDTTSGNATTFNPNASTNVEALVLNGTTLYVGGWFSTIGGQPRNRVAALDTTLDTNNATAFDPNVSSTGSYVNTLALSGTTLYVGGEFTTIGGQPRANLAAVSTATGIPTTFDPSTGGYVVEVAVNGTTLYTGGDFTSIGGQARANIAAIETATGYVTSFNPTADNSVSSLAVNGTTLYVGGSFTSIGGQSRNRIAALSTTTGLATTFNPNASSNVYTLLMSGTTLYVGGVFTNIGGQPRNRIAALDTTLATNNATTFNPNASSTVDTFVLSGTTLYVSGAFTSIGGQPRNRIAALDTTLATNNATTFDPNADARTSHLVLSGTTLYVGGSFTNIGGQPRNRIAALNTTLATNNATTFNPDADGSVGALLLNGTTLYVGGIFTSIGGQTRSRLAALDTTLATNNATTFNPNVAIGLNTIGSLTLSGNHLFAGGIFSGVGTVAQQGIAQFNICDRTTYCNDETLRGYVSVTATPSVNLGTLTPATSATASASVVVQSNSTSGYTLYATDTSDTAALPCSAGGCGVTAIPDWAGAPPTTWTEAGANYGFGVTVLSSTLAAKDSATWGTGTLATDFVNNKYAGLASSTSTVLHTVTRYLGTSADTTVLGLRARVSATQTVGTYTGTITITALANP